MNSLYMQSWEKNALIEIHMNQCQGVEQFPLNWCNKIQWLCKYEGINGKERKKTGLYHSIHGVYAAVLIRQCSLRWHHIKTPSCVP